MGERSEAPEGSAHVDTDERQEIKKWLRQLRENANLMQAEVAYRTGQARESVGNAENPKRGLPEATALLRMLRLYGAVADAPVFQEETLESLLRELSAQVDRAQHRAASSFASLEQAIDELADRLPREDDPPQKQAASRP